MAGSGVSLWTSGGQMAGVQGCWAQGTATGKEKGAGVVLTAAEECAGRVGIRARARVCPSSVNIMDA